MIIRTTTSSSSLSPATESWRNSSSSFMFISRTKSPAAATTIQAKINERSEIVLAEGPSCLFVGPVETASKDMLEALYLQARDSYYSGRPLVLDDMFDKVELMLRRYGSQSVVKYPRCSLKRQSTYSDAEEDASMVLALASIWTLLLAFGSLAILIPSIHTLDIALWDNSSSAFHSVGYALDFLASLNKFLVMVLGSLIGFPITAASVKALQRLWRTDLVALRGSCPNCGEQVFAFLSAEKSEKPLRRTDCHVCECCLEFRTKVERSKATLRGCWVYGRIYLVRRGIQR